MNRKQFLALAGSAVAAVMLSPAIRAQPSPVIERRDVTAPAAQPLAGQATKIYCGTSVTSRGRFRHYLVNGKRVTERTAT